MIVKKESNDVKKDLVLEQQETAVEVKLFGKNNSKLHP